MIYPMPRRRRWNWFERHAGALAFAVAVVCFVLLVGSLGGK